VPVIKFMRKELAAVLKFYALISRDFSRRGAILFAMLFFSTALLLPFPFLTKYLFDNVILNPAKANAVRDLIAIAVFMFAIQVFYSVFMYYLEVYRTRLDNDISIFLRNLLTQKLAKAREEFFRKTDFGTIFHRYTDDLEECKSVTFDEVSFAVIDVAKILFGVAAMLFLSVPMTLIVLMLVPFYVFAVQKSNTELVEEEQQVVKKREMMYDLFFEYIRSVHLVKTYVLNTFEGKRIGHKMQAYSDEVLQFTKIKTLLEQVSQFIGSIGPLLVLVYGVAQIIEGKLTVGSLIAFTEFVPYLFEPANGLVSFNISLAKAYPSVKNVLGVLAFAEEHQTGKSFAPVKGHDIIFDDVSCVVDGKAITSHVSFVIPERTTTAIVGKSGAGKTSILRLVEGFWYPSSGKVLVGGADTSTADIRTVRSDIGYVLQETTMLHGTVRENIALDKRMSLSAVRKYARIAQIDGVIEKLPKKYEAIINPEETNFSGGQLQRLSLARALAQQKRILLLDEFSSEIDPATEQKILSALSAFHGEKTMVIVTHDERCLKGADAILVIEGGRLMEQGSHASLSGNPHSAFNKIFRHKNKKKVK